MFYLPSSINDDNIFFGNNDIFPSSQIQNQEYYLDASDQFNSINEEEQLDNNNIPSYYLINKGGIEKNNILKSAKSTQAKTNEDYCLPNLYTPNDVLDIFNKDSNKQIFSEFLKQLNFNKNIEDDLQLTKKKRNRTNDKNDNISILIQDNFAEGITKTKKRGRQTNKILKKEIHTKMWADNIIKKIKTAIFKYPLLFLNNILKAFPTTNKYELLKIDYEFINRLKKERELKLLDMSLKDLFSQNISSKYSKYEKEFNKNNIENILSNGVNDTILFAFNMTLRDWLDIFTLKKTVNDIYNKTNYINYQNVDCEKIEKNLVRIDKFLKIINEKNKDENYMSHFIFYLYNYERWFYLKRGRNRNKKAI